MNVIAFDPFINPDAHLSSGFELASIDAVFEQSRVGDHLADIVLDVFGRRARAFVVPDLDVAGCGV